MYPPSRIRQSDDQRYYTLTLYTNEIFIPLPDHSFRSFDLAREKALLLFNKHKQNILVTKHEIFHFPRGDQVEDISHIEVI